MDQSALFRLTYGLYYLTRHAGAFLSCEVRGSMDLGTHTLFIAEVMDGAALSDQPCCTYTYYQTRIKPRPVQEKKKGWVCPVCKVGSDHFSRKEG